MLEDPFSVRHGFKHKYSNTIYDDAPESIRVGLRQILAQMGFDTSHKQRQIICQVLRRRPDENNWSDAPVSAEVDDLIHGLEWYEFYDLCEKIARLAEIKEVGYVSGTYESIFANKLNKLFQEESIGYHMMDSYIEKIGSEEFKEATETGLKLLQDPKFRIPSEQYEKALSFRNGFPPDYPNAVKEAVNAVEGTLQVAANRPGVAAPTILTDLNPRLPSHIERIVKEIYGFGSAAQGARHAGVGGYPSSAEEAEFIIHISAAAIKYIIINVR